MKYLAVVKGCNEPDNNTPSDVIWARVIECEPVELEKKETDIEKYWAEDYPIGVEIITTPLSELEGCWKKVNEIW